MTTMTWMTSQSIDSAESARRKECVTSVYRKQTSSGVAVNNIDVNAEVDISFCFVKACILCLTGW